MPVACSHLRPSRVAASAECARTLVAVEAVWQPHQPLTSTRQYLCTNMTPTKLSDQGGFKCIVPAGMCDHGL